MFFYYMSAKRSGKIKKNNDHPLLTNEMLIKHFSGGTQEQAFGHKSHRGSNYGNTWVLFTEKNIPYNKVSVDVKKRRPSSKANSPFFIASCAIFGQELSF